MSRGLVNKSTGDRIPSAPGYIVDKVGDLSALHTTAKDKAVSAINEVADAVSAIDDGTSIDSFADVENALADKTDTDMVAADFNVGTSYTAGNYCVQDGKLYRFKNNHSGAWSASDVEEVKIAGELSSIRSGLTNLDNEVNGDATVYPYADVITIEDAIPANVADCTVKIEPVQDLHGYDKPWVGGAGKNKAYVSINPGETALTEIKDSDNNVIGVNANSGAASVVATIKIATVSIENGKTYTLSGSPDGKGNNTYRLDVRTQSGLYNNWNEIDNPTITATEDITLDVYLRVAKNYAVSNLVFHPQIEEGSTATTFAPYTNICPITGHTEASVQRDGKNLFDVSTYPFTSGYYINALENGDYVGGGANFKCTASFVPCSAYKGMTLTLNKRPGGWRPGIAFYSDDSEANFISGVNNNDVDAGTPMTFTVPSNANYMRFTVPVDADNIQLELGSTATPYVPYSGKTYTIALGDTIYGGTVDFDSGVMTVDRAYVTKNTSTMNNGDSYPGWRNANIRDIVGTGLDKVISDVVNISSDIEVNTTSINDILFFRSEKIGKTETELKALAIDMECVLPLTTPTTIQLTPQQIQLLKGTNTLTASTGQISVTVNGVSGAIGSVQEQVNELADRVIHSKEVSLDGVELNIHVGDVWYQKVTVTLPTGACIIGVSYGTQFEPDVIPYVQSTNAVILTCASTKTISNKVMTVYYANIA